jgi:Uma2 family endonuclease
MDMETARKTEYYTYADWLSWDEDVRAEIVDGQLFMMAPPTQKHQEISGEIYRQIANFLKGKPCKVFPAPFGVRLNKKEDTALEPDIVVVCDKSKLDGKVCNGAPDMVIEITSPSTERTDRIVKYNKYQQAGVREYWIVDTEKNVVDVYILENGKYFRTAYEHMDTVPVHVLEGCKIDLRDVFAE